MEELKELVKIVTDRGKKNIPLLDLQEKRQSKETLLFQNIHEGKYKTDEEAADSLYGTAPDDVRYRMIKSRLRKKLLNHLFFIDFSDNRYKTSHKYEQECHNLLYQAQTLIKEHAFLTSEKLLQRALTIAKQAEFTKVIINCLELLLIIYAHRGKQHSFYETKELLSKFREIALYEQRAEEHYYTAKLELNRSIKIRRNYLPELATILPLIKDFWEKTGSFNIFDFYYMLTLWYYELIGNYSSIINVTNESEQLIQKNKINTLRFDHRYNKYMSVFAHLQAKNYSSGLILAKEYVQVFDYSSLNWFAFMENYFLLALHAKQYDLALQLLNDAQANPAHTKLGRLAKERWSLYQKYLYFVYPSETLMAGFNYQEFISSVPEYSKDKQGFNVAILLLQFLHYLQKRDMEALIHRMDSLRKYAGTHLRDNFSQRTKTMFKLLQISVKEDFNPIRCKNKGRYLYEKLPSIPPPGDAFAEIEIIPYEHMWEIILTILSQK